MASTRLNNQQVLRLINLALLIAAVVRLGALMQTLTPASDDFKSYRQSAVNLQRTGNPYQPKFSPDIGRLEYRYPPLFSILMVPFTLIDQLRGQHLWFLLNCGLLFGFIGLALRLSGSAVARRYWGLVVLATCFAPPTLLTLQIGQISIMVALLLVGMYALQRAHPRWAGVCLAVASMVRIYPAILAAYHALQRRWRVVGWSIISGLFLALLPLVFYGITPYSGFLDIVRTGDEYPFAAEHNISLYGLWGRMFRANPYTYALTDAPWLATVLTVVCSLALIGVCVVFTNRGRAVEQGLVVFCIWLCGLMLVSTTNGYYNHILLLLPLLVGLRELEHHPNRTTRNLLILATLLVCVPPTWSRGSSLLFDLTHTGWGLLLLTPSFYGVLGYIWVLVRLLPASALQLDHSSAVLVHHS